MTLCTGVCSVDQFVYAVGGYDGVSQLSSVERYSVSSDQWTCITPMTCPRSALTVSIVSNNIYAIGKCCQVVSCMGIPRFLQCRGSKGQIQEFFKRGPSQGSEGGSPPVMPRS